MAKPFIVIEALDAGGSQTQTDVLVARLRQAKRWDVRQLHFPQEERATGRLIYNKFLLNHNKHGFTKREQTLLYVQDFFSRAEDIKAQLDKPKGVVVSDRFYTSTLAYQTINLSGQRRHSWIKWIKGLTERGTPRLPQPTIVILLDTPVEISWRHLRKKRKDYFESRQKLTAVRRSYVRLAREENWTVINSVDERGKQRGVEDIHQEVWEKVQRGL